MKPKVKPQQKIRQNREDKKKGLELKANDTKKTINLFWGNTESLVENRTKKEKTDPSLESCLVKTYKFSLKIVCTKLSHTFRGITSWLVVFFKATDTKVKKAKTGEIEIPTQFPKWIS